MGRSLNIVIADLPEARRARIDARAQVLINEVEALKLLAKS